MNLIEQAEASGLYLCAAESLTAGRVATEISNTAGASKVFLGSLVSYSDCAKSGLLQVDEALINESTAVDSRVASQMASGARVLFAQSCAVDLDNVVSVATTGVAGPDPVGNKPVGLVFIAVASRRSVDSYEHQLQGSRSEIADQAAKLAIAYLREHLDQI